MTGILLICSCGNSQFIERLYLDHNPSGVRCDCKYTDGEGKIQTCGRTYATAKLLRAISRGQSNYAAELEAKREGGEQGELTEAH